MEHFNCALILNEQEFLMVFSPTNKKGFIFNARDALFKYNARTDEWSQCWSLPWRMPPLCLSPMQAMQIDHNHNRMFFLHRAQSWDQPMTTSVVDLHNGSLIHQKKTTGPAISVRATAVESTMVNVGGTMYKMGGTGTAAFWNDTSLSWEPIRGRANSEGIHFTTGVVLVPSKDFVLMIGGWLFHERSANNNGFTNDTANGIWRYYFSSGRFEEMKDEQNHPFDLPYENEKYHKVRYYAVLSSDERFVIIAARDYRTHFQVLDIGDDDHFKLWDTSITVPDRMMVMTKSGGPLASKLLIFGWIRKRSGSSFVPATISTLISEWCSLQISEMIHCFIRGAMQESYHQMISLADILSSRL